MLADFQQCKNALNVPATDPTQDGKVQQLVQAADAAVKSYCHRQFETNANITEFPWQGNGPDLPLLQRPVVPVLATGTLTQSSTSITNIVATAPWLQANILAGMSVAVTGAVTNANLRAAIPPFTTISSLNPATSPTSVAMSAAATAGGSVPLIFGLDVYIDFGGNYGFGLNAFKNGPNNSSRMFLGLDYVLKPDSLRADGSSASGLLTLLGQSGYGSGLAALSPIGWGFGSLSGYGPYGGPLTQAMPPLWPTYPGCICATYCAGLGVGATAPNGIMPTGTTIPADLTGAVVNVACWLFNSVDAGAVQVTSESYQGYSRGLSEAALKGLKEAPALGSTRDILSRHMEVVV